MYGPRQATEVVLDIVVPCVGHTPASDLRWFTRQLLTCAGCVQGSTEPPKLQKPYKNVYLEGKCVPFCHLISIETIEHASHR